MEFFSKLYKSSKKQPSPQELEMMSNDKKMEYILQKIKTEHQHLMNEIDQEFSDKVDYQQNVCYKAYTSDMDKFAHCVSNMKSQAGIRVNFYKKKIAFISIATSQCLFNEKRPITECKDISLELSRSIMESELNFIENWNPHIE